MNKMSDKQKREFARFITPHLPLKEFSGMKCSIAIMESWGINIDYHEFSYALDELNTLGHADVIYHTADGMAVYSIRPLKG